MLPGSLDHENLTRRRSVGDMLALAVEKDRLESFQDLIEQEVPRHRKYDELSHNLNMSIVRAASYLVCFLKLLSDRDIITDSRSPFIRPETYLPKRS